MEVNFKSIVTSGVEQIEINNSAIDQDETRNTDLDHERFLITRIHVPELCISKCLQFSRDQFVWDVKQQCLASLPKVATWFRELKESFNYGLFCPPTNGKAGKFLDEERRLGDYPFNGPVGYLELKYKKRIYKMLNLDEKQLKAMHNKTNLKKFLEHVTNSQTDKISRMCNKGLDPNFHCPETGETPLTFASTLKKSASVIIALVNGGAILDYRTKDGLTAMHRAVERNNLEAVKTLLELGASPNYKDSKALTPLYYSVTYKTDPMLCEALLHDHASLGAQDLQGWQEVHQACRNNLVQHLDHLLFYGADMNARNASGNTPLHVCAVNNTDSSCIRQLLFRGAQKDSLNFANQTPYQVAVIAGNLELAEVIKNYGQEEVVPFKGPPRYNPNRRSVVLGGLTTSCSANNLGTLTRIPYIQQHVSFSSSLSSGENKLTRTISVDQYPTGDISTEQQYSSKSLTRAPSIRKHSGTRIQVPSTQTGALMSESHYSNLNKFSTMDSSTKECLTPPKQSSEHYPSTEALNKVHEHEYVQYSQQSQCTLNKLPSKIKKFNSLWDHNVRSTYDEHYQNLRIEGIPRSEDHRIELQQRFDALKTTEMPPSPCPSSRSLTHFSSASSSLSEGSNLPSGEDSVSIVTDKSMGDTASDVISDSSGFGTSQSDTNSSTIPGSTVVCVESYCSAIPGHLSISEGDILEVTGATDCGLLEGILRDQGMGLFPAHCVEEVKLRNSSITTGLPLVRDNCTRVIGRRETPQIYFATAPRLKKTVPAQARTVILHRSKKGFGFVLRGAKSHALIGFTPSAEFPASQYLEDVDLGGISDLAGLKKGDFIIKINGEDVTVASHDHVVELIQQSRELVRMTVISPIMNHSSSHSTRTKLSGQSFQRQYATLPRKGSNNINAGGTLGRSPAPLPPRRDPKTTLSIGRARARSMVAGLEGGIEIENRNNVVPSDLKSTSIDSIYLQQQTFLGSNVFQTTLMQPRTMSLRIRPTSARVTNTELKLNSELCILNGLRESLDLHRDFHSTPDLNLQTQSTCLAPKCHRSQEDVSMITFFNKYPPPSHPPPPPPVDQLNTTSNTSDINNSASVYDNMAHIQQVKELAAATESGRLGVMSSFRPLSSAKLYASPKDLKSVGYRSQHISTQSMKQHIRKPNSVRVSKESTSFKCIKNINKKNSNGPTDMNSNGKIQKLETNQYAQPLKSLKNDNKNVLFKERMDKNVTTSFSAMNLLSNVDSSSFNANAVPPLPEPDYSLSESENEAENNLGKIDNVKKKREVKQSTPTEKLEPDKETSEHSNASGDSESNNSYNSGSLPHSFSIEEIQNVKKQLKTKQSFAEDGDNSSSGVSSDQDIPVGPPSGFDDTTRKCEARHHANEKSSDKENCSIKRFNHGASGILTRHAVSLTQLPPPIEAEAEDQSSDLFVPPPPGFNAEESCTVISSELVFAPPPQFCDNRQQLHNCVKIIRTVSKP